MKDQTADYIAQETAAERKPTELYHIWNAASEWHYTNGDVAVVFGADTYIPGAISRGSVQYNSELEISTLTITFTLADDPVVQYIAQNPLDIVWVEVSRLHRAQDPLEKSVIFIGQISSVTFQGLAAEAACVGFEHFLKMPVPTWRYQLTCNHRIFDTCCALAEIDYLVQTVITLDATGTILTSAAFDAFDDDYFLYGEVRYGGEARMITDHTGSTITLAFAMRTLETGVTVDVLPGCDGKLETCRDKYNNPNHALATPFIPVENPARRTP